MNRLKEFKHFALIMMLFTFVAAGSFSSCRETKEEKTEEQAEHPEGEEHPTEDAEATEEHPSDDGEEHPEGEEHPAKDSVSG